MERLKNRSIEALRSLEKYTKTDMVYLAKGGFWLGIGQFVATGSAFIISIAFANLTSPETYGLYKYILSINSLLLITTLSGMDSAITQSVARGFDGTLKPAIKEKIKWGAIGSIISLGISIYYFIQGNMILTLAFSITAVFTPFTESFDMYNSLLWGKKLFDTQTKYNIIKKCIALVLIVSTLFLTKNIYFILLAYFISITIPNIFIYFIIKNKYQVNQSIDPNAIKYGKNLSFIYIITLILGELDKILVFHYVGAINLAIYSLAVAPNDQIKGLLKNVNSLAMPQFSKRSISEIKNSIWHKVLILGLSITGIVIIYILLAPMLFKTFFPKYLVSIPYSQILSLSLIPVVISGFLYTILEAQKAEKQLYQYNIYNNIFSLIILFPLVYFYGIWGAIFSRLTSRIFGLLLSKKMLDNVI